MLKAIATIAAAALISTAAVAQQGTAPPPPTGPTEMQCQDGYKEGMQWTRDQFTAACTKLREGKKN
jgi:hypothetical protein